MADVGARPFWRDRIRSVTVTAADLEAIVAGVPEMSAEARTFSLRLLETNRERGIDMTVVAPPDLARPLQEPAAGPVRRRLIVTWQDPKSRLYHQVGWLTQFTDGSYGYDYVRSARHLERFHPFIGFHDFDQAYHSPRLFPFFAQRLLSPGRSDLPRLLAALAMDVSDPIEPVEFLARSGGRRGGDTVELLPEPLADADGSTCWLFLVHGVRHVTGASAAIDRLMSGDNLDVVAQPDNPVNPEALLVTRDRQPLGWVPDPLLEDFRRVIDPRITVVRANTADLGHHLRFLVKVTGRNGAASRVRQDRPSPSNRSMDRSNRATQFTARVPDRTSIGSGQVPKRWSAG